MPHYDYDKDYPFAAFITNLGKYNEGALVGEWVKFPTTAEELNAYRDEKNGQIPVLSAERTMLRNQLKQAVRNGDEPAAADIRARIAQISGELKTLRKEVSLCENIAIRSGRIKENLAALGQEQNKIEGKELETDEHIRRSSGSGRENDAKRR